MVVFEAILICNWIAMAGILQAGVHVKSIPKPYILYYLMLDSFPVPHWLSATGSQHTSHLLLYHMCPTLFDQLLISPFPFPPFSRD